MLQLQNRKGHPHNIIIDDLIKLIKEKQNGKHKTILTIDKNEPFVAFSGGIANICRKYKLYDPLHRHHRDDSEGPSNIRGSKKSILSLSLQR